MALFELNIYGKDDEITKRFETDRVRWGVYLQAAQLEEQVRNAKATEQFEAIGAFIKKIFPELTDADLENADSEDVMNTFKQLVNKASGIQSGEAEKNA